MNTKQLALALHEKNADSRNAVYLTARQMEKRCAENKAGDVESNIIRYLRALVPEAYAWKVDVKGTFRNGQYTKTKATAGAPDIHICYKGRFIGCEVKWKRDKISDAQKQFEKRIANSGGRFMIARTFTDFYYKFLTIKNSIDHEAK